MNDLFSVTWVDTVSVAKCYFGGAGEIKNDVRFYSYSIFIIDKHKTLKNELLRILQKEKQKKNLQPTQFLNAASRLTFWASNKSISININISINIKISFCNEFSLKNRIFQWIIRNGDTTRHQEVIWYWIQLWKMYRWRNDSYYWCKMDQLKAFEFIKQLRSSR